MDISKSVPELSIQVSKSVLVVTPVSGEVDCSVWQSSLDDQPASPVRLHVATSFDVAVRSERSLLITYCVDTAVRCGRELFDLRVYNYKLPFNTSQFRSLPGNNFRGRSRNRIV